MKIKDLSQLTLAHVLMVSFLLSMTAALLMGTQQVLRSAEESTQRSLLVSVLLQSSVTDADAKKWGETLRARDPEIVSADYISKQAAFEEAQKDPALARTLMVLKTNPLPASFLIQFSDRAWWERTDPTEVIKSLPEIQEIRWDAQAGTVFRSLHQWRLWLFRLGIFTSIVLVVWSLFGVYRFLSLAYSLKAFILYVGVGLAGGIVAVLLWGYYLHGVGADASAYRPAWFSWLPLITGAIAGMACFGLGNHEP